MEQGEGVIHPEANKNIFLDSFNYAVQPVSLTSQLFRQIDDDWRLKNIQKNLPSPEVITTMENKLKLEFKQPQFHIIEIADIDCIQAYKSGETSSDDFSYKWLNVGKYLNALDSILQSNATLKLSLNSVLLLNQDGTKQFSIVDFLKKMEPHQQIILSHIFTENINAATPTEVHFTFPATTASLFSLFHEIGHKLDPTVTEEKFEGDWFDLYEFSKRGKKGENIRLAELATSERNAWAFSYRTLKQLRHDGFIQFTNDEFLNYMQRCLTSYEEATKNIPGNYTPVTHFLSNERAKERHEYRKPTLPQRFTHLRRKLLGN